jgi:TonB family protein
MLDRLLLVMALVLIGGCASTPAPVGAGAMPAMDVQPVRVTTTYIAAQVPHSARGEYAIVEVCVAPDGAIDSSRVTQSSTDKAFDAAATQWARQASYRPRVENGRAVYACEEVRVEINRNPSSRLTGGADSALG